MSGLALGLGLSASGGATRDPDAAAVMAAMAVPPDDVRAGEIDRLVTALKGCGVWQKLDSLFVFAAHHEQAARIDWKQPTRIAVAHGGPVFEVDRGWAFDGVDDYLATGFVPFDHCTQATGTAGSIGAYERTNVAANSVFTLGCSENSTSNLGVNPRTAADLFAGSYNHATTGATLAGSADSRGLTAYQRVEGVGEYYRNGTLVGAVSPSSPGTALPAVELYVGGRNANDSPTALRASRAALAYVGAALTSLDHPRFYAAIQTHMTAIGAAV